MLTKCKTFDGRTVVVGYNVSDRFQAFVWQWYQGKWVIRNDLSNSTWENYQLAEGGFDILKRAVSKMSATRDWYYVGLYYKNGANWEFQKGEMVLGAGIG